MAVYAAMISRLGSTIRLIRSSLRAKIFLGIIMPLLLILGVSAAISAYFLAPLIISSTTSALKSGLNFLRFVIVNSQFEHDIRLSHVSKLWGSLHMETGKRLAYYDESRG